MFWPAKNKKELTFEWKSTLLNEVGMTWLEQATSRPPDVYSNQLSYIPNLKFGCKDTAFSAKKQIFNRLFSFSYDKTEEGTIEGKFCTLNEPKGRVLEKMKQDQLVSEMQIA